MPGPKSNLGSVLGLNWGPNRRLFLLGAAATAWPAAAYAEQAPIAADAIVGPGAHSSVGDAIAAAPANERPWSVLIMPGRWREKLSITRPNVALIGQDRDTCVLTYDDASRTPAADGHTVGTSGSFSVAVRAPGFSARSLTIENAFDYNAAAQAAAAGDQQAAGGLQAVALMLADGADRCWFEDCAITGHQDTLFTNAGRSYFHRCRIAGAVDFIFGAGRAYFSQCQIVSRERPDAQGRWGWVSAASTPRGQFFGLVFDHCTLTKEPGVPSHSVGLGRFWRPTRDFPDGRYGDPQAAGSTTFLYCWLGNHIIPEGWDAMGYNAQGGGRAMLTPEEARPAEFGSRGPGAHARAFLLQAQDVHLFDSSRVLSGWSPGSA